MQGHQRYPNPNVNHPPPQYQTNLQPSPYGPPQPPQMSSPPQNQQHQQQQLNNSMANLSVRPQPNGMGHPPAATNGHMNQPPPTMAPNVPNSRYPYQQPQQQFTQPQPNNLAPPPPPSSNLVPPTNQYDQRPMPPMRPGSMRPTPGHVAPRPFPNGQPPSSQPFPQNPNQSVPPQQQHPPQPTQSAQAPQMSPLVVPRPVHKLCGKPRPYFSRSMIGSSNTNRSLPPGMSTQIPPSNSDYITLDDGNARLRFARLTTNAISTDPQILRKSQVPFAVILQPFANIKNKENEIPIIKSPYGPLRCQRCNAYANPGFKFINGGQEFQCNLCYKINRVPKEHFSPISLEGLRMDHDEKPELKLGSVDYVVESPDYYISKPQPSKYVFAIDVSLNSIQSGLAISCLQSIKSSILANLIPGCNYSAGGQSKIALITFDKSIHFYDARSSDSKGVKMHIVPDIMDPFVPIGGDALFLKPSEAIEAIDTVIEIHNLIPNNNEPQQARQATAECSLGSVLQTIKDALQNIGGKVYVVSGSIPTSGINKLERRGGGIINGNEEREMALLKESNASYDILGCEMAENNISVDLILAPTSIYVDCSTLSRICRNSGGKMFLFTGFDIVRDGASLHRTICSTVSEPRAFEALLRVRTSPGVVPKNEYIGNFGRPQRGEDVSGPVFDSSSTIGLELSVESKLDNHDDESSMVNGNNMMNNHNPQNMATNLFNDVCIQCAVLYTDCNGTRRIRVHTIFVKKTSVMADMFSCADVDTTAAFLAKRVASAILYGGTPFSKGWGGIMQKMSQMFYMYRKHCTASQGNGQLILPEAYKTLPILMLGLIKSTALRKNGMSDGVTIDERASALSFLISATIPEIAAYCYPRVFELHNLSEMAGVPLPISKDPSVVSNQEDESKSVTSDPNEPLSMPDVIPCSSGSLDDNKILLIENGMQLYLWIGNVAENEKMQKLVGQLIVQNNDRVLIRSETANSIEYLKNINDDVAKRAAKVIQRICNDRKWLSRPVVVERMKPGTGSEAKWILPLLVEDKSLNGMGSYMEYLRNVHKEVMDKMANENAQNDLATWEMLNHGY